MVTRPDGTIFEQACVTLGDFMIELFQASPERASKDIDPLRMGINTFALRVDDMASTLEMLKAQGVKVSQEPRPANSFDGLRAEVLDPNGLSIELREWQHGDNAKNLGWQPENPAVTLKSIAVG